MAAGRAAAMAGSVLTTRPSLTGPRPRRNGRKRSLAFSGRMTMPTCGRMSAGCWETGST